MKKLFTSTILAAAAVPFLVAAPAKTAKVQNTAAPAVNSNKMTAKKKVHKTHSKKGVRKTATATPASAK